MLPPSLLDAVFAAIVGALLVLLLVGLASARSLLSSLLHLLLLRLHRSLNSPPQSHSTSSADQKAADAADEKGNKKRNSAKETDGNEQQKRALLAALPDELLLHVIDLWCSDADAVCFARCNSTLLRPLLDYRVKHALQVDAAIRLSAERAFAASSSTRQGFELMVGLPVFVRHEAQEDDPYSNAEDDTDEDNDWPAVFTLNPFRRLEPLRRCNSLCTLEIRLLDDQQLANDFSRILPPQLQSLVVESAEGATGMLRVCESSAAPELHLPASLTSLTLPILAPLRRNIETDPHVALCPIESLPPTLLHLSLDWFCHWGNAMLPPSLRSLELRSLQGWRPDSLSAPPPWSIWPRLPERLHTLSFGVGFSLPLDGLILPASLRKLDLSAAEEFDQPIEQLTLPAGLQSLLLGHGFSCPFERLRLPPSLTELHFDEQGLFFWPLERLRLPASLTSLILPDRFNQSFPNSLPSNLLHLRLGEMFYSYLPPLPPSLRSLQHDALRLGPRLKLPPLVQSCELSGDFSTLFDSPFDPLSKRLLFAPNSALTHLHLSDRTIGNHSLEGMQWPANLRSLHLMLDSWEFGALKRIPWPDSLQELRLGKWAAGWLCDWTPPPDLTHLWLDTPPRVDNIDKIRWPPVMQRITFRQAHWGKLQKPLRCNWPSTLTAMQLIEKVYWEDAASSIAAFLPSTLRRLQLPRTWWGPGSVPLPAALRELEVGNAEHGSEYIGPMWRLLRELPPGLQTLKLHHQPSQADRLDFSASSPHWRSLLSSPPRLPPSLTHLTKPEAPKIVTRGSSFGSITTLQSQHFAAPRIFPPSSPAGAGLSSARA